MLKEQSTAELVQGIQEKTITWYPNEYHFISEELFNDLMNLFAKEKQIIRLS
ncbi:hypothetical protein Ga0466249_003666 [Sporomusaceae bacterium BoRhaA]|uniref:hypothetical protein n=1 Tax=Pelorhabdus rhamnosifermentans TaxID=2772457 RepID=UPI001C064831|nr:hypothetical protein [Pelorhabdus rhamnosifermentans]MBU2702532.1 hypothetical protein [Pelorhabdus rhamnosifermentans]